MRRIKEKYSNFKYKIPERYPQLTAFDFYFLTVIGLHYEKDADIADIMKESADISIEFHRQRFNSLLESALTLEALSALVNEHKRNRNLKKQLSGVSSKHREFTLHLLQQFCEITDLTGFLEDHYSQYNPHDIDSFEEVFGLFEKASTLSSMEAYEDLEDIRESKSFFPKGSEIYKEALKAMGWTPIQGAEYFQTAFTSLRFFKNYGGQSWASIAKAYKRLITAHTLQENIIAIDHIYDLEHNTGSIFEKDSFYYQNTSGFPPEMGLRPGYLWIEATLDAKAAFTSSWDFYGVVSPQLRQFVARISKDLTGVTLEQYRNKIKEKVRRRMDFILLEKQYRSAKENITHLLEDDSLDIDKVLGNMSDDDKEELLKNLVGAVTEADDEELSELIQGSEDFQEEESEEPVRVENDVEETVESTL
jgi:hypothetical protein